MPTLTITISKISIHNQYNIFYSHVLILNNTYYFYNYTRELNDIKCNELNHIVFQIFKSKKHAILNLKHKELYIRKIAKYRLSFNKIKLTRLYNKYPEDKQLKSIDYLK